MLGKRWQVGVTKNIYNSLLVKWERVIVPLFNGIQHIMIGHSKTSQKIDEKTIKPLYTYQYWCITHIKKCRYLQVLSQMYKKKYGDSLK